MFKKNKKIIQIEPWINHQEAFQLLRVIKNKYLTENKLTEEFENKIKELTKSKYAVSIANGSLAIYAILKVLGIGPGDEVIVPDLTFVATANSVLMTGAKPILCDVKKENWGIDPNQVLKLINKNTKAVIPVHLYGFSASILKLKDICRDKNIYLLEDAAQGVGVLYKNRHVGTFGEAGILSFYGNKTITCGEGGIVLTNSAKIAKDIYKLKNHGRERKGIFEHECIGYNLSFTEMQAAICIAQLKKLNKIINKKQKIHERYRKRINSNLSFTPEALNTRQVHWFTSLKSKNVINLQKFLNNKNIQTRRIFLPLHMQPCFQNLLNVKDNFPNSTYIYDNYLSLPSSYKLRNNEIDKISFLINKFELT